MTLVPPTPGAPFPQYPHFLHSFGGSDPSAPRSTIYMSIERDPSMTCTMQDTVEGSSEIAACQ